MDVKTNEMRYENKKHGGYAVTLRASVTALICVAAGALAGRTVLPFGVSPLGIALLCAAGEYSPAVLGGLILSLIGVREWYLYLGSYILAVSLRALTAATKGGGMRGILREWTLGGSRWQAGISAAVAAFAFSLYRLIEGGFSYYDLFGAFVGVAVAALGALLWSGALRSERASEPLEGAWNVAAYLAASYFTVYALRAYSIGSVDLSVLAAMLIALYTTRTAGALKGAINAIAAGIAVSVTLAPSFAFGSVCYALLSAASPLLGCFSAFAAGLSWGVYMEGISALSRMFPALMAATLLFFVFERLFIKQSATATQTAEESASQASRTYEAADVAIARLDDVAGRIKELCEGFSEISEALLFESETPSAAATFELGQPSSSLSAYIDGTDIRLKRSVERKNGKSRDGKERLIRADELADRRYEEEGERVRSIALDLRAISEYLASIMLESDREYFIDTELSEGLFEALRESLGDNGYCVSVLGGRKRRILISSDSARQLGANAESIRRLSEQSCGFFLDGGELLELGGRAYLSFCRRPTLKASMAGKSRSAIEETDACGDSLGMLGADRDGVAFAYICDGMGSGAKAASASGLCSMLLQKLLRANEHSADSVRNTFEMINGLMRHKNCSSAQECTATVDLGAFDLIDCRASFYKSGAAPTYVFRDGYLFKVRSRTIPIGIVSEPDIGRINMELLPEDVIIMVSDGITGGREEYPELFDFLRSRLLTHSPAELVDAILDFAEQNGSEDDLSAVVIRIEENVFLRS